MLNLVFGNIWFDEFFWKDEYPHIFFVPSSSSFPLITSCFKYGFCFMLNLVFGKKQLMSSFAWKNIPIYSFFPPSPCLFRFLFVFPFCLFVCFCFCIEDTPVWLFCDVFDLMCLLCILSACALLKPHTPLFHKMFNRLPKLVQNFELVKIFIVYDDRGTV